MLPGEILSVLEIGPEIPVQKLHPELRSCPFGSFLHQFMVLVGADKEAGGEAVEAAFGSLPGSFKSRIS